MNGSAHISLGASALAVFLLSAPASVFAQSAGGEGGDDTSPHGYQGVIPGTEQPPAVAPKEAGDTTITWPGFQMLPDGSSRFFVQATGNLGTILDVAPAKVKVTLGAAKLATAVNGLTLETRFFNTPVKRAVIEMKEGVAYFVLYLRASSTPTVSAEQAKTGFHFVYVDFPAGQYLETPTPAPTEPKKEGTINVPAEKKPEPKKASAEASGSASGSVKSGGGKVEAKGKAKGKVGFGF